MAPAPKAPAADAAAPAKKAEKGKAPKKQKEEKGVNAMYKVEGESSPVPAQPVNVVAPATSWQTTTLATHAVTAVWLVSSRNKQF